MHYFIIKPLVVIILNVTIRNDFNIYTKNTFIFLPKATFNCFKFWMRLSAQFIVLFSKSLMQNSIKGCGRSYNRVKQHICANRVTQNDQKHSVDKSITRERNHSSSKRFTNVYSAVMIQNMANTAKLWTPEIVNIYHNKHSSRSWVVERCLEIISTISKALARDLIDSLQRLAS